MRTIICLCLMVFSCTNIEKEINKKLIANLKRDALLDQGYIYFDSIGNIRVEFNNLEFATNPLYTESSYIGVWVYAQNGDPLKNCCTGSVKECGELTKSCIKGVGFSNDLGFLGDRYLFIEPPRLFNKYADKYYMDVKVSDAAGVPRDYQGEYQPFSGPTNPVGDREIFDLYLGVFYSVFRPDGGFRAINSSASFGSRTIYTRVDPDFLSPRIRIESRFFSQTPQDPVGSMYVIPHLSTWKKLEPLDRELDKRKYLKINEIGNSIGKVTANDYIELYNPTEHEIFLDDVYLFRYTSERCSKLKEYSDRDDLSGLTIKPKGFLLLARSGSTLNPDFTLKNVIVGETDCFALATGGRPLDPTEEVEDNPSADYKSIYKPRPALSPEPRIIDFVGTIDPDNKNYYLGSGPAPVIAYNAADYIGSHADLRLFYFYARFGGTNQPFGGADRTNNGTSGNFIDRDFSVMRGFRLNLGYRDWFRTSFTYAESFGIDRKIPTIYFQSRDVDNNGKAYGLETEFAFWNRRLRFTPTWFYAQGGKYYPDGTQYSHGFVSMKADQVGGLLVDLYWGVHPSAYTSGQGVADLPYNRDRKTGTLSKHLGISFGILENLFLKFDVWRIHDTNKIEYVTTSIPKPEKFFINQKAGDIYTQDFIINSYANLFPDNSTIIRSARRFGTPLGEEYNVGLDWSIFKGFKFWATFGVFKPMRYFATAGLIQGAPQGNTHFTGFQMGTTLIF